MSARVLPTYAITSDADLCGVLSDLKHALKVRPHGGMCDEFNALVNAFIAKHGLDHDPHEFASLPQPEAGKR